MNMAMGLAFAADLPLMASTFRNQYGHGRLGMGSEPQADLLPHLVPAGQPTAARQPLDVTLLPVGAHRALTDSIGHHGLEDLLILPGVARVDGRLRRRCLYTPLRVLGVGDRAVALRVQAPPALGIRAEVPFGEMAAIARRADGTRRQLLITGSECRVPVRYDAASDGVMNTLVRHLRRRAAGASMPVPAGYPVARSRRRPAFDPGVLKLDPGDEVAAVGQHGRSGSPLPRASSSLCVRSGRQVRPAG
jgi:hypothetical protein